MTCPKPYSRAATFVMAALLLLLWCSCNPYKQLSQRPPLTTRDSVALLSRCIKIVPIDTSGHVMFITTPDSSDYWKAQVKTVTQTITDTFTDVMTKYRDTCTSAIKTYQQGLKQGYDKGFATGNDNAATKYAKAFESADSLYNINLAHLKQSYELKLASDKTMIELSDFAAGKYRTQAENRGRLNTWLIIALAVSVLLNILQWKFKRVEKTANTVINDVRSLSGK